ncbi:hypothetical protein UlMin_005325 [Ulmus minor]
MKFEETFSEFLQKEQERLMDKCTHVEYKRLKKVLKSCRNCRAVISATDGEEEASKDQPCECQSTCQLRDQEFFSELMKEASEIAGCFSSRVRHLLHLHIASGMQKYLQQFVHCFKNDEQAMVEEGRVLIEYATMNAIAIRKILKKYDKIHSSDNGKHFKSKMRAEHLDFLQSPWFIELGAFYLNLDGPDGGGEIKELLFYFSCDLNATPPIMTMTLSDSTKLDYDLTCAVCLETVFNPYALTCGHLFCKSCACSAASVMICQGLKAATPESKCPVCRETGVYEKAVHMLELDLLVKRRCKDYWKERMAAERVEMVKQTKEFWDLQTKYIVGYG